MGETQCGLSTLRSIACCSASAHCWRRVQTDTDPISAKCWARVASAGQYSFNLVSTSCWQECVHLVYTASMSFKCWPALYTIVWHRTNVCYTNTLPGQWWAGVA